MGDMGQEQNLDVPLRARFQGFERQLIWPEKATEVKQKDMVAQCIPPPFAEVLSKEVLKVQVAALREIKLKKAVHAVAEAGEEYAEALLITRQKEIPEISKDDADEKPVLTVLWSLHCAAHISLTL